MKRHPIWQLIGPLVIAVIGVALLLFAPHHKTDEAGAQADASLINKAAVSLSSNVYRGQALKNEALELGYVPFFGSSELSRMDPLHPSVLADKYDRDYQPFLLGKPGTQSLSQLMAMQTFGNNLDHKKVVFILSPQWFTKQGQNHQAFNFYKTSIGDISWTLRATNTKVDRITAKRLLKVAGKGGGTMQRSAWKRLARGENLTGNQRAYFEARLHVLQNEDHYFDQLMVTNRMVKLAKAEKQLPATDNNAALTRLADRLGKRDTHNRFDISNAFYRHRLKPAGIRHFKNSQRNFDYRRSPEYTDFELVLNQFASHHTNTMFILPPVNNKWAAYTGLSQTMLRQTNAKLKQQLASQGFTNVVDLSNQGGQKYFMSDTIHLGWRGWLAVDQHVKPFLTQKQPTPHMHIKDYYLSKTWANHIVH
ncbi:D-alanyl-lipoteichoic acid biosynthesis protein DltD [Secundilactobacillus paracollinoides]|uniref:D-alanyl-lipoteichoic acid biosynthesis protein DltD n=1 Tax=Secundilactobacillus paracollinoides TaxID=240427 RepID=UPI00081C21B9|nr:D-alanyl-lipoteichoic acid biosynthesis protein DltD [Secundilactobacillus paracollinoides]